MASLFVNVPLAALQNTNGRCGIKSNRSLRDDEVITHPPCPPPAMKRVIKGLDEGGSAPLALPPSTM